MHLKLKSLTGKDKEIEIEGTATILEFKNRVYESELIPPEQQRLVCNGKILTNEKNTLSQYKISSGNVIHMILALRGGSSHMKN
ncbi:ubiquitin-like protein Nedd8 [Enteropsectra breve]|nr:ubiquitin-like protein Nedd8 [Enteropsectra breve]